MSVRYGIVVLPTQRWSSAVDSWRFADEAGFEHAWTLDHLMWRDHRAGPWFSALPVLSAAAVSTRRVHLGTLVASPNFRHPVTLAKEMMTLDDVSGGRAICGIGSGAYGYDAEVLGMAPLSPRVRAERLVEFTDLLDRLLRHAVTTYRGSHYEAVEAHLRPGCVQRPRLPLAVAASGPSGLRATASYADIWVTNGPSRKFRPQRFEESVRALPNRLEALSEACRTVQRDPSTIRRLVLAGQQFGGALDSPAALAELSGSLAEIGVTDLVVFWPGADDAASSRRLATLEGLAATLSAELRDGASA
ncbi:LLM class flavin-dependent oxidoreductase [Kribbella albertanoniae]|uniref:LLM class flavin-dependent oxidoreductase n=1 Tax=Kribbella albertanoniae TaxID=1266829 RepID=A0A4R4QIY2_9ACTN|nr:LLM class flavin-dependent oxidoreductase [Kribbella albertanoniae]